MDPILHVFVDAGQFRWFRPLDGLGPAAGVTHRVGYSLGVFKEALSGLLLGVVFVGSLEKLSFFALRAT